MRATLLILASAATLLANGLPTATPEDVGMSSRRLTRVRSMIDDYITRREIAGAVTLIVRRGKVIHYEAQGLIDLDTKKPMQKDAMFRLASMTKPITSVAAMMLWEQGKFHLNDPISKWIPEFKEMRVAVPGKPGDTVAAERPITVQQLFTHTSGLANIYGGPMREAYQKLLDTRLPSEPMGDFVKRLAKLPLNVQPGSAWEYGPATDVLGNLVEIWSGKTLDAFFRERIFAPLEMNDSYFYVPDTKIARLATAYAPGLKPGMATRMPEGEHRLFAGAGGLISTAMDYARFCQMSLNGGQLEGARLLGRKTIELMTVNHIGALPLRMRGQRFGLGYRVVTDAGEYGMPASVGSYGWSGAYGTSFWIDPKEELIGIMMIALRPNDHLSIQRDFEVAVNQAVID